MQGAGLRGQTQGLGLEPGFLAWLVRSVPPGQGKALAAFFSRFFRQRANVSRSIS